MEEEDAPVTEEIQEQEERFDDLMAEELHDNDEEIKENEDAAVEAAVEAEVQRKSVTIDDTLKEDFFEAKVEKEEQFGEIEGMTERTAEDDEDEAEKPSEQAEADDVEGSALTPDVDDIITDSDVTGTTIEADIELVSTKELSAMELQEHEETEDGLQASQLATSTEDVTQDGMPALKSSIVTHRDSARLSQVKSGSQNLGQETREEQAILVSRSYTKQRRAHSTSAAEGDDLMEFFDFGKHDNFMLMDEFADQAEEEAEPTVVEEMEEALDRTPYYEKYGTISEELIINRIRNHIVQKIVTMYLKRRKVGNFLKDVDPPLNQLIKYGQKLDAYEELMSLNETQRTSVSAEVNMLRLKRDTKREDLTKMFKALQTKEANTGYSLIYAKTGNQIADKLVERFIRRQATQADQVSTMRLKFIKLKGMVQEKLDAIDGLDNLENNLHLADYEQLKVENRSYSDKLEERDEELTRLRTRCQNTIQILAHMREKTAALDTDLADLQYEFDNVEGTAKELRETLTDFKHSRDRYRQMARKIKDESGLLTKPDLLRDMEDSQNEINHTEAELAKCKKEVEVKTEEVRKLRKNIETQKEAANRRRAAGSKSKLKTASKLQFDSKTLQEDEEIKKNVYTRRPTLYMPIIMRNAFDDLVKIRPSPKVRTKTKR